MAYMNQYFGNYRRGSETLKKEWDDAYARCWILQTSVRLKAYSLLHLQMSYRIWQA